MSKLEISRVLCSDPIDPVCKTILETQGIVVDQRAKLTEAQLCDIIPDYDGIIVRSGTKVTAKIIAAGAAARLKVIGRAGTGVDNIDIPSATKHGVLVMNTPGGNTLSAAEHTCVLIGALARHIAPSNKAMKEGRWDRKLYQGVELNGKVLAVLGLGRIGREVAVRMQAFGMKTIGYDPIMPKDAAKSFGVDAMSLEEIWPQADFITVHTPLLPSTKGLVGFESLPKCKKGVRIVNCARGGIVDEQALLESIECGHCAGAGLDVYTEEPPKDILNNKLLLHPKVLTTPHLGASTDEAQTKVAAEIAQNIANLKTGGALNGIINAPALFHALKPEVRPWNDLCQRIGSTVAQLQAGRSFKSSEGREASIAEVHVTTIGKKANEVSQTLVAAVLVGLLSELQSEAVNLINAESIASERGLKIATQKKSPEAHEFSNVVAVTATLSDGSRHQYEGTVSSEGISKLIMIDNYKIEIPPVGNLILYRNQDKPGVLATVSQILAESGVNIGHFTMGRSGGQAMSILNCDEALPVSALEKIQALEFVDFARSFVLPQYVQTKN